MAREHIRTLLALTWIELRSRARSAGWWMLAAIAGGGLLGLVVSLDFTDGVDTWRRQTAKTAGTPDAQVSTVVWFGMSAQEVRGDNDADKFADLMRKGKEILGQAQSAAFYVGGDEKEQRGLTRIGFVGEWPLIGQPRIYGTARDPFFPVSTKLWKRSWNAPARRLDGSEQARAAFFSSIPAGHGSFIFVFPKDPGKEGASAWAYEPLDMAPADVDELEETLRALFSEFANVETRRRMERLGLPSDALDIPAAALQRIHAPAGRPPGLGIESPIKERRMAALEWLAWIFSLDAGAFASGAFAISWAERRGEGGFEPYALSWRPAWCAALAMPIASALLVWAGWSAMLALSWILAAALGGGLPGAALCAGSVACLLSALTASFLESAALCLTHNVFIRRLATMLPLAAVGGVSWAALSEPARDMLHLSAKLGAAQVGATLGLLAIFCLLGAWAAHASVGRFLRLSWQPKGK